MKNKKIISSILIFILLISTFTVNASVLGNILIDSYTVEISKGLEATYNQWYSDQSGVEQQTENYLFYTPNDAVEPIITNGDYIYGRTRIDKEVNRLKNEGIVPLAGTNADFFSLQTGVPMSNVISDGKIITKDNSEQYGIGFSEDNAAFMAKFRITSTLTREDGTEFLIHNINKYRQPYEIYMMTDEFSSETHNNTNGIDVILGDVEGDISIGSEITGTVEYSTPYGGSIAIPKDKIVITVDEKAPNGLFDTVSSLQIGEKVKISFGVEGDERWEDAKLGLGAVGDVLVENGKINTDFEVGANPRTALGITEDGKILLYTIDGRQKGYSYGLQLRTLAKRMAELGCTDAFNLDGGGSTSFVVQFPGDSTTTLNNKPSDGSIRSVSNFIFFKNNLSPTKVLDKLTLYPLTSYVLKGGSIKITAKASDTANYPMATPTDIQLYTEDALSTIDADGTFTAKDNDVVRVYASSGNITGHTDVVCVETPTEIKVIDESNKKEISKIALKRGETAKLSASAFSGYNKLVANDTNFIWNCDDEIGTIDANGTFTAADVLKASGSIYVNAGEKTVEIPVNITRSGNETDDELYTNIDVINDGNDYTIKFESNLGITVDKKDVTVKINGNKFNHNLQNNKISFTLDEKPSSITVFVTNSENCTTFYTDKNTDTVIENPFTDTVGHWANNVISNMYANRIINGENTPDGLKFNPDKSMTRAEFAVMITNYLGVNIEDYDEVKLPYSDINKLPEWSINSFKALYKLGIVKGSTSADGNLYANPSDSITRAETATIIARTLPTGIALTTIEVPDKDAIATWAYDGISTLITTGAIGGYKDGTIKPLNNVTKAEAAKILYSIM